MNIRNLSFRDISLQDTGGNVYIVPAYSQLTGVDDALWNDNEFRRWLRFRIRDIVVESLIGGGGSYGPNDAPYVTMASNVSLTNESVLGTDVVMRGAVGSRPAAGTTGKTYYVTDANSERVSRDNGTTWDDQKLSWSFVTNNASIDSNARVGVQVNTGTIRGPRRKINFITGSNSTVGIADNAGNESVDVSIGFSPTAQRFLGSLIFPTATGTLTANKGYLTPITVPATLVGSFKIGFKVNSGGGTGHVDAGFYYSDSGSDPDTLTKVATAGSTATPANGYAELTIASATLTAQPYRRFYIGFGCDSATPTFFGFTAHSPHAGDPFSGFPLPASALIITTQATGQFHPTVYAYNTV